MSKPTEQEKSQVRATLEGIAVRVKTDPEFKRQLRANPAGVLQACSLPAAAIAEVIRGEPGLQPEVQGYELDAFESACEGSDSCYLSTADGPGLGGGYGA